MSQWLPLEQQGKQLNGVVGAAHGDGLRFFPVLLILECDADNIGSMDVDQVVCDVNLIEEEPEVAYL
jgi:hypothetical protein